MGPHRMPAAEVDLSPGLVRRLLAAQHPGLAGLPVEPMANGWDNALFRVGDDLMARLPRRALGARIIVNEQRWLPLLGPGLPLPVPAPVRIGAPGLGYPWPWSIVPFLPGEAASRTPPADPGEAAVSLGRFLAALHMPAAPDAPANATRGIPLADRDANVAGNLRVLGGSVDREAVLCAWETALAAPRWERPPVWLHGDLHPANVLVDGGRISAVIDFGDITSGDPATDLSVAWMLLPRGHHGAFRDAYRGAAGSAAGGSAAGGSRVAGSTADDDADGLWARARGWALTLALVFLAHSADNPELLAIGRRTLDTVLG